MAKKKKEVKMPEKEEVKEEVKNIAASLEENKVVVFDNKDSVYEPGYYGKDLGDRLELSIVEALLLLKRGRIKVMNKGKAMTFEELYKHGVSLDKRFPEKYRVYEDLRERGLLVRTGGAAQPKSVISVFHVVSNEAL